MKRVVLCADDYGLTEGVSRGILELAQAGRISATSAMTSRPAWPALAPALRPLAGRIAVGLHLNLTCGAPLGALPALAPDGAFGTLKEVLQRAFTGRLPQGQIRAEIDRQLDAFEGAFGSPPAFVDGHQHVHVLPVIRPALIGALAARGLAGRLWLRDPSDGFLPIVRRDVSADKALVVKALSIGFGRAVREAGFDTNRGFSGFSPFDPGVPAQRVFARALSDLGPRPLVMAHPGYGDEASRAIEPEMKTRDQERLFLASAEFARLLEANALALVPRPA